MLAGLDIFTPLLNSRHRRFGHPRAAAPRRAPYPEDHRRLRRRGEEGRGVSARPRRLPDEG